MLQYLDRRDVARVNLHEPGQVIADDEIYAKQAAQPAAARQDITHSLKAFMQLRGHAFGAETAGVSERRSMQPWRADELARHTKEQRGLAVACIDGRRRLSLHKLLKVCPAAGSASAVPEMYPGAACTPVWFDDPPTARREFLFRKPHSKGRHVGGTEQINEDLWAARPPERRQVIPPERAGLANLTHEGWVVFQAAGVRPRRGRCIGGRFQETSGIPIRRKLGSRAVGPQIGIRKEVHTPRVHPRAQRGVGRGADAGSYEEDVGTTRDDSRRGGHNKSDLVAPTLRRPRVTRGRMAARGDAGNGPP